MEDRGNQKEQVPAVSNTMEGFLKQHTKKIENKKEELYAKN